jgi:hypothetical protein
LGFVDEGLLITVIILVGVLVLGAIIIAAAGKWRTRPTSVDLSASDQLAQFREMHERGEISEAEFQRLRAVLAEQMRQDLNVKPRAPATPAAPPDQTFPPESSPNGDGPNGDGFFERNGPS